MSEVAPALLIKASTRPYLASTWSLAFSMDSSEFRSISRGSTVFAAVSGSSSSCLIASMAMLAFLFGVCTNY